MWLALYIRVTLRFVGDPVAIVVLFLLSFQICRWTPNNDNPDNYWSIGSQMPKCTIESNGIRLIYNAGGRYVYLGVLMTRLSDENLVLCAHISSLRCAVPISWWAHRLTSIQLFLTL